MNRLKNNSCVHSVARIRGTFGSWRDSVIRNKTKIMDNEIGLEIFVFEANAFQNQSGASASYCICNTQWVKIFGVRGVG